MLVIGYSHPARIAGAGSEPYGNNHVSETQKTLIGYGIVDYYMPRSSVWKNTSGNI